MIKILSFEERAQFYRQQASMLRELASHAKDRQSRVSYTRLAEAFETEEQIARALAGGEGALGDC